jgi:hydroxymethylpyrimidine kinase/phosphomethylpyrimidine kinase
LSIAGTDPTGGAGIQADLKSIAANGGYAMAAVTALVAQNTMGVRSVHVPPPAFLAEQLTAVSDDVVIDAVKIGMLFNADVITVVADWLAAVRPSVTVLDPVMVAASGDRLMQPEAEQALRRLLPAADLVTPNVPELAALLQESAAETWSGLLDQARRLAAAEGVLVLAKGGHLPGPVARDALVGADGPLAEFTAPRVATGNTHGTGCSLSSAIATQRCRLGAWEPATAAAKRWLTEAIAASDRLAVGRGHGPVSHFSGLWRSAGLTARPPTPADVARDWWDAIAGLRAEIDNLEFIRALADGSLDRAAFVRYLAQDALYLRDYARALAAASSLAPTPEEQAFWAASAHGAIATEMELHKRWLPADDVFGETPDATTTAYVDHLLAAVARADYAELAAALLPCYWLYDDLGSRLVKRSAPEHPYAAWLDTYGDPSFAALTRQAIDIVTARAAASDEAARHRMRRAFLISSRHERDFFAAPLRASADSL